jgi:hypothetical protein
MAAAAGERPGRPAGGGVIVSRLIKREGGQVPPSMMIERDM